MRAILSYSLLVLDILLLVWVIPPVYPSASHPIIREGEILPSAPGNWSYQVYCVRPGHYGYNILLNGKMLLHQSSIPGLSRHQGFQSRADAAKVAGRVTQKAREGTWPATPSLSELKVLGVVQ